MSGYIPVVSVLALVVAFAVGFYLAFRPLAETVKDTLAWWATVPEERRAKPRFIITPEIEARALLDWKARG